MIWDNNLLVARRLLAVGAAVTLLGMVSPAWADDADDEENDPGARKEIRVYKQGDDDSESDDNGVKAYQFRVDRADVKGGYLGVQVQDVTRALMKARDLPSDEGALVNRVVADGPASHAGIRRGDVIVSIDGNKVSDSSDLIEAVRDLKPGEKVDVIVLRERSKRTLRVEIAKRPKDMMMVAPPGARWRGNMDPDQMREWAKNFNPDEDGPGAMGPGGPGGPEMRAELKQLHEELDQLREEINDLRQQLEESQGDHPRNRSGD